MAFHWAVQQHRLKLLIFSHFWSPSGQPLYREQNTLLTAVQCRRCDLRFDPLWDLNGILGRLVCSMPLVLYFTGSLFRRITKVYIQPWRPSQSAYIERFSLAAREYSWVKSVCLMPAIRGLAVVAVQAIAVELALESSLGPTAIVD